MYSKLIIVGNVGKDPESRFTPSGQQVTSFSVAVNRQYHTKEEDVKETTWFRVATWGKLAEVTHTYVKKGMLVLVEGTLTPDRETGGPKVFKKSDGASGATFEVNAQTVKFLSRVESEPDSGGQGHPEGQPDPEDELPF